MPESPPRLRWLVIVVTALALANPSTVVSAGRCWRPPVDAPISEPYREPACRWCPGNRGIEYGTPSGTPVVAVATGRVAFVGTVAGTGYVVVVHADGRRATYGNVSVDRIRRGDLVVAGAQVGSTAGAFHFGVRDGDRYVDPTPLIGRLVYSPRLIPHDGSAAAAGNSPKLRCGR